MVKPMDWSEVCVDPWGAQAAVSDRDRKEGAEGAAGIWAGWL